MLAADDTSRRIPPRWLSTAGRDLPLDADALFPEGDGFMERRRAARRAKWVSRLRPVLSRLEPGEVVRHVALGVRYRFAEFYFNALAATRGLRWRAEQVIILTVRDGQVVRHEDYANYSAPVITRERLDGGT